MWTPVGRALVGDFGSGQALTDDQFRLLEPLIPPARPGPRPPHRLETHAPERVYEGGHGGPERAPVSPRMPLQGLELRLVFFRVEVVLDVPAPWQAFVLGQRRKTVECDGRVIILDRGEVGIDEDRLPAGLGQHPRNRRESPM